MSTIVDSRTFSPQVEQQLADLARRLRLPAKSVEIWERLLTAEQREQITADPTHYADIIVVWSTIHHVNHVRAVIDLGFRAELLSRNQYEWLLADVGESQPTVSQSLTPSWNPHRYELSYDGVVIRRVRGDSSNTIAVIEAFETAGWPERIQDPLPGGRDPQRLCETIWTLNRGLSCIRFRADGAGNGVIWELR